MNNYDAALTRNLADLDRTHITVPDGTTLTIYRSGPMHGPKVIIVNPIGVPVLICSRLMRRLATRYHVTCWMQRGCGAAKDEFFARPQDYQAFADDLLHIAKSVGAPLHGLIGVCSGASLAVHALAAGYIASEAVALISPAVRFNDGYVASVFDRAVVPYMYKINGGNHSLARDLLDLSTAVSNDSSASADEDQRLLSYFDKWGMRSVEDLLVYARTVQTFHMQRMDVQIRRVHQPVSVFAAADDHMVAINTVRQLTKMLPGGNLTEYSKGGHFSVFTNDELQSAVVSLLDTALSRVTPKHVSLESAHG